MQRSPHLLAGTEIYRPLCTELQQIRLLTILPGSGDDELRCHLSTASLQHEVRPSYETISYAWGDRDHRANMLVNNSALNVPRSTKDALLCMRSTVSKRVVWIDAICINQNDVLERGAQVSIMGSIYMHGSRNLVFLGNDVENVAETVLTALYRTQLDIEEAMTQLSSNQMTWLSSGVIPASWDLDPFLTNSDLTVYAPLYGLPWFRRLWVVQEAAFAVESTCCWGSVEFPLFTALLVAAVMYRHRSLAEEGFRNLRAAADMYAYAVFDWRKGHVPAVELLSITRSFEGLLASEPRDRVFAAVQLYLKWYDVPDVPPLLIPDYEKSVADVYRDATRYIFEDGSWVLGTRLEEVRHRSSEDLEVDKCGFTSWTIRFDRAFDRHLDVMHFTGYRKFHAGYKKSNIHAGRRSESPIALDANLLILKAMPIDSVARTTPLIDAQVIFEHGPVASLFEQLCSWTSPEVIVKIITAESLGHSTFKFTDASQRLEAFHIFRRYISTLDVLPPDSSHLHEADTRETRYAAWFQRLFRETSQNRRIFQTERGWLGCGPKMMQDGDVVYVEQGATFPYILRHVEGTQHWKFIGVAYVRGLMRAEALDMKHVKWERVALR